MTLWIILTLVSLASMAIVLSPLLRKQTATAPRIDYDVTVYRDQLSEVSKDVERGIVTPDQADAACREIHRRMLVAEDADRAIGDRATAHASLRSKVVLAALLIVVVPLGAGLTYAYLGSPELPAKPYSQRQQDPEFVLATQAEHLAERLEKTPDAGGYKHLANIYFALHQYDQAVAAYQQTIQLTKKPDASLYSELGEAIALAHGNFIVPEAQQAFSQALRVDPHEARAIFYLGLAHAQLGELRQAVAIWRKLEKDSPSDAPWLPMIRDHIASFAKEGGFDSETVPPESPSLSLPQDAAGQGTDEQPGTGVPTGDGARAIMEMSPDDQNVMIHKMVDRLAAKMKDNPNDIEGWTRLARAYRVLGDTDKAKEAEDKIAALKAKAGNP